MKPFLKRLVKRPDKRKSAKYPLRLLRFVNSGHRNVTLAGLPMAFVFVRYDN